MMCSVVVFGRLFLLPPVFLLHFLPPPHPSLSSPSLPQSLNASLEDVVKQLTEQLEVTKQEKSSAKGSQTLQREVERLREENSSQAKALMEATREREELTGELELMKAQVIRVQVPGIKINITLVKLT